MRILVTGGAGFIGSHFIRLMMKRRDVRVIINLDKLTYAGHLDNLRELTADKRYRFVRGDIASAPLVERLMKGIDHVVNFAAETHVDRSIHNAAPFLHSNVIGVQVLLESHGDFARVPNLLDVLQVVHHPQVGVLWDVHHPFRFFSEPLADTYEKLNDRIRHVHLKNSVPTSDGVRYSLMSQGDVPVVEVLKLLVSGGYDGWIAFEWEKRWHPEIEEPEVALPDFVRVLRTAEAELDV